jgi:hypothetical protein
MRSGRIFSLRLSIRRAIKDIVLIIEAYYFSKVRTNFYLTYCFQGKLHVQGKLLGIVNMNIEATGLLLFIYSAFVKYLEKQCTSYLYTSRKIMIQLGGRTGIIFSLSLLSPRNWQANKNHLNETYSIVWVGIHLYDMFPIRDGFK